MGDASVFDCGGGSQCFIYTNDSVILCGARTQRVVNGRC